MRRSADRWRAAQETWLPSHQLQRSFSRIAAMNAHLRASAYGDQEDGKQWDRLRA